MSLRAFARVALPLCLLPILLSIAAPAIADAQEFDATALTAPADLATGWRVHAGDDPSFASTSFDDSQWPAFDARTSIHKVIPSGRPPVVWYRLRVKARPGQEGLALREWSIASAFEVYVNGRRLLKSGSVAPFKPYTFDALLLAPISSADTASGSVLIAVRVHISHYEWGGAAPGLWYQNLTLGQYEALNNADWLRVIGDHALAWLNTCAWLAMGIVGLALFAAHRGQREYLWMFLTSLTAALTLPLDLVRHFHTIPANWELARQPINIANLVFSLLTYFAILRIRFNWWLRSIIAVAAVGLIVNWFGASNGSLSMLASVLVQVPIVLLYAVVLPVLLFIHHRRGNREAGILLIAALIQSLWLYVVYANAFLQVIPATALAATNFALVYLNPHVGPFLINVSSLTGLLYVLCLTTIIVLRATRVSRQQALIENELEATRQVQQVILPEAIETIPGYRVETVYHPAQQVGGDFFQVVPVSSGGMLLVVGDVAGKGLPAAMLVSVLVGAIRGVAAYTSDPAELLGSLNERMVGRSGGGFSTALAAHISASGQVSIANAGHLPPYLNGAEIDLPGALPLGVQSGIQYSTFEFRIQPGSRITFLSDGVVEAQNAKGELYGFERSRALSSRPAAQIADAARRFGQCDDITVVSIERIPAAEPEAATLPGLTVAPVAS
ncbi:MAG TPA: SpoIIE family protein phosphatase [Terracidiphilus sp.]|nr:SpoIIE family protein phosphatase [Terracidiphilus sp.]